MKPSTDSAALKKSRIDWIDCAKGIGIALVVIGHSWGVPHWIYCLIYGFHMPLFFLLSGLTHSYDSSVSVGAYIKKLAKAYLLPYLTLCLINLALQSLWTLYLGTFSLKLIGTYCLGILYCYANTDWMPNCSPLWFLCAIFIVKLLHFLLARVTRENKVTMGCAVILGATVAWIASVVNVPRLPWNLLPALMGSLFFWVGTLLRNSKDFLEKGYNKYTLLAIIPSLILSPWIAANVPGMNENYYCNVLLFLVSGFGFSFLLIFLSTFLKHSRFLSSFLGRNTIVIMGFNYFARTFAIEGYYLIPYIRNYPIPAYATLILTSGILLCIVFIYTRLIPKIRRKKAHGT